MYIKKIVIDKIRCFEHIEIDLSSQQGSKRWVLLLGDNGVGKTTVLRCIAMALMGSAKASGLLSELYGEWIRGESNKPAKATIHIEFDTGIDDSNPQWIETTFERTNSGDTNVSQKTVPEDFPWDDIFVCGYGAARRAYGSKDYAEYSAVDSLYTLFNYDAALQNPELILRRIKDAGVKPEELLSWIDKILMLPKGSAKLGLEGITVNGPWGKFMPLGALGDGHQATLAWLTDMLGWVMFYDKDLFKEVRNKLSGIVLIDEIEHHLHPSWQKEIIKLLAEQFPNLQFIATTHSPLCAIGSANLPDDKCSLVLLTQKDNHVIGDDKLLPPRGRRADQVLTSYLFGLDTTRSDDSVQRIERYSKLLSKNKLTEEEQNELGNLRIQLDNEVGSAETKIQQLVEKAVRDALDKLVATISKDQRPPKEAIDFEMRRQLNELFGKGSHDKD